MFTAWQTVGDAFVEVDALPVLVTVADDVIFDMSKAYFDNLVSLSADPRDIALVEALSETYIGEYVI